MRGNRHLLAMAALAVLSSPACAQLPVERFTESAAPPFKRIPPGQGYESLTEAVTTEFGALIELVRQAVRDKVKITPGYSDYYVDVQGMYADRAIVRLSGRLWAYPYTVAADNTITVAEPSEVVASFSAVREAAAAAGSEVLFREAADGSIEVTLIRAGLSLNGNFYPDAALRDGVPLFEGVRVFVKSDETHTKGGGKDVSNLLGAVYGVRFAAGAGADSGSLVGTFKPINPADAVVVKMTEAVKRGMQGLMGLSIDATAHTKREQRGGKSVRVAQRFVKAASVDLIVEPGAGGGLDRLAEAAASDLSIDTTTPTEDCMNKKRLLEALAAINAARAAGINAETATTSEMLTVLQEACATAGLAYGTVLAAVETASADTAVKPAVAQLIEAAATEARRVSEAARGGAGGTGGDRPVTQADLAMFRVRGQAAVTLAGCGLPAAARERLQHQLDARERFTEAEVTQLIADERKYLARFTESGTVRMGDGSGRIEVQDRSVAIGAMLDAFFDPENKNHRSTQSFKECYIEMTGDRRVTGRLSDCDLPRLRESLGDAIDLREAISSTTFSNVLGDSITRRMLQVVGQRTDLQAWRRVASVTSVNDFRSNERTQMGGYGNLPAVSQGADYQPLTSPGDAKASYAVTKRGGLETLTLEAVKNDDSGVIRRIPVELALAASNTLYEFVFDFFRTNPTIYDTVALYHATHNNLFTTAFSGDQFQAHRLAMQKQVRMGSNKRRGITPRRLLVPVDMQQAAYDAFQRNQNLDQTFVATVQPEVIVVDYWTDTNDWVTLADPEMMPVLEIGFLDGKQEPELFVQDMPNVGSLFSADKITWKIRHIYSGAILPEGEKGTTKAVVA